jgi:F0F1-type ATP synthase assembly protein I
MKTVWFAVAFGAALLLSASTVAVNAMGGGGSCHLPKTCAVDLNSLVPASRSARDASRHA